MSRDSEARLISLRVPQLFEDFLERLKVTSSTNSPASVIAALREFCNGNQALMYYSAVAAHFEQIVSNLAEKGFPEDQSVFFTVPQRDGSSVELFPGGAQVLVTSHNVDRFLALYQKFKVSMPYRYTDHVSLLPLAAHHHLASDFATILDLLEKEISKWKVDKETWAELGLSFCVPRSGVLLDLIKNGRSAPVSHQDLSNYLQLARKALFDSRPRPQNLHDFENYLKAIYYAGKVPTLRALDADSFKLLDVHYCVPIMGKLVDLVPNGQDIVVPFAEKDKFCEMAAAKLGITLDGAPNTASAVVTELQQNAVVVSVASGTSAVPAVDGLMSPRRYAFNLFAPSRKDALANSLTTTLTNDEILFHFKTVLRQLATGQWSEADLRGLNIFYEIPVNGQLVPLVEDGFKIPVTLANKDDFVVKALDALHEQSGSSSIQNIVVLPKRDMEEAKVLNLFSPSHFEVDLFAPYVPSEQLPSTDLNQDEQTFWMMLLALQNGFQPANLEGMNIKFALQLPNGNVIELKPNGSNIAVNQDNLDEFIAAVQAKKETIHLAFKYDGDMLDPILQFPKERAHLINPVQLSAQDLKAPIFTLVEGLAGNDFTPQDFEAMKLMYCIPFAESGKVYNLVPDGKNVLVTAKYRDDYIQRVLYERERLQQASVSAGESSSKHSMGSSQPREVPGMRRSITSLPLTDAQVTELRDFRSKVQELEDHFPDETSWNDLGLAWVIRCGDITFDVIPDGSTKHVSYQQRKEFITKCVARCDEIIGDQEERKNVAVPQAGADEMGLFSPTHFTQDLFAPAQHITTKANLSASVLHVSTTTTTPVPQRPATPTANPATVDAALTLSPSPPSAPRTQARTTPEGLAAFLQQHKIVGVETALADNGVVSLSDLMELQESDVREIITAVLPRRRLVEALATLR